MRDVQRDPRPGDVVQIIPRLSDTPPPPLLTVDAVDAQYVYWHRADGMTCKTHRGYWTGESRMIPGPHMRLVEVT